MNTTRLLAALAVSLIPGAALAQSTGPTCVPTSTVPGELLSRYGEVLIGRALARNEQTTISIYVSESGSWTLLVDRLDGVSCIVADGYAYTSYPAVFPKQGTDG